MFSITVTAQDSAALREAEKTVPAHTRARRWLVGGTTVVGFGGSFAFLNAAWYKNHPRSSFHTFDDSGEWMQMDKIGHAWSGYHISRVATAAWDWAGVKPNTAILLGSGSSLAYLLSIEYLDGLSADWGWSWPDVAADVFGTGLYAGQQLAWKDQRIQIKFSAHRNNYETALELRADKLFGTSLPERILKDYNGQTYWLSANIRSFLPASKLPSWLNIAVGHGAEGMFGGYENLARDKDGNITFDRRDIPRRRQWYLAPDIDLTRIKTRSRFLRSLFSVVNVVKVPAPALELSGGKLRFVPLAF